MQITEKIIRLGQTHIAGREDIYDREGPFPFDIWTEMGRSGMLGLGLPREFGGGGVGYVGMAEVAAAFVRAGKCPGLASAWLGQTLIGSLILVNSGSADQQGKYLAKVADGSLMVAVAISEPNAGAHPKRLAATARREGGHWVLNGEKAWITNGPIADLYIILAISEQTGDRKQFSAYLVPRETPGLTQTSAGSVDYLRPTKHGGLHIQDCRIPAENLLGREGEAFETISRPVREVEDVLGLAIGQGGRAAQLDMLAAAVQRHELALDDQQTELLGALAADQAALGLLGGVLAAGLDRPGGDAIAPLLAARRMSRQFQTDFASLIKALQLPENPALSRLSEDLTKLGDLALNVDRAKQVKLGKSLITKAG